MCYRHEMAMKVPNTSELWGQHALCGQAQTPISVLVLIVWRKYQAQVPPLGCEEQRLLPDRGLLWRIAKPTRVYNKTNMLTLLVLVGKTIRGHSPPHPSFSMPVLPDCQTAPPRSIPHLCRCGRSHCVIQTGLKFTVRPRLALNLR